MRNALILLAMLTVLGLPASLFADSALPHMRVVEPTVARVGAVVKVTGENLDRAGVAALYLTDGKNDVKVMIMDETASSIVFKIPAAAKAGRVALMVLTTGKKPMLIQEPVKVTVE